MNKYLFKKLVLDVLGRAPGTTRDTFQEDSCASLSSNDLDHRATHCAFRDIGEVLQKLVPLYLSCPLLKSVI